MTARYSVMVILLFAFLETVIADQICIRTRANWYPVGWVADGGTNCALKVKAYVKHYGWKYAFIDMHATSSWRDTEYGNAFVSRQRVHEHTDSCFEMQSGFGSIDENKSIYVSLVDDSCDDAMWVDKFFIPHRDLTWGDMAEHSQWYRDQFGTKMWDPHGFCMNGKKHLPGRSFVRWGAHQEDRNWLHDFALFDEGCAREIELRPYPRVHVVRWGSTHGTGSVSGRRALRKAHPEQNPASIAESQRQEVALIGSIFHICKNADDNDYDRTNRYEAETQRLVARCFQMLTPFLGTYAELREAETATSADSETKPEQDGRFMGFPEPMQREVSLIEDLYNVCEDFEVWGYDRPDRYEAETQLIVARCFQILTPFLETYQEFQEAEEKPIEADLFNDNPRVEDDRESQDLETSESDRQKTESRLLVTVYPLP